MWAESREQGEKESLAVTGFEAFTHGDSRWEIISSPFIIKMYVSMKLLRGFTV